MTPHIPGRIVRQAEAGGWQLTLSVTDRLEWHLVAVCDGKIVSRDAWTSEQRAREEWSATDRVLAVAGYTLAEVSPC